MKIKIIIGLLVLALGLSLYISFSAKDVEVKYIPRVITLIYTELIQKDSLISQSILSTSKETLLYELVDSAKKDIRLLKTSVNSLSEDNTRLYEIAKDKDKKIIRNRKISVVSVCVAILAILLR